MNTMTKHLHFWVVVVSCQILSGCINDQVITTRPEYAYPQNLQSLCGREANLMVSNRGYFVTDDFTDKSYGLLLSPQLLPFEPEIHRDFTEMTIAINQNAHISTETLNTAGDRFRYSIPPTITHCNASGELIITYPADVFYFWASIGNKTRELVLWTNDNGELIIQNRWRETQTGLVSGEVKGDAWAIFNKVDDSRGQHKVSQDLEEAIKTLKQVAHCQPINGSYTALGEVISPDGRVQSRAADVQFFREEIIGTHPINQQKLITTKLELLQDEDRGITLNIYGPEGLLASRLLNASDLSCVQGKWEYQGEKKAHSAWLLFAASAGIYWENMRLWRDSKGDLLVSGVYKSRGTLLFVPFGRTEETFVAFAKL